jgi:hypothetical protein
MRRGLLVGSRYAYLRESLAERLEASKRFIEDKPMIPERYTLIFI